MSRSIYVAPNYEFCKFYYRWWRRFHQFVARLFPPDWVYVVWAGNKGETDVWKQGIYLHQRDAEGFVRAFHRRDMQAYWEQFPLKERGLDE